MNTEQIRAAFEAWWAARKPAASIKDDAFAAYQAGRASLQSQAQIPAPTNRDEYIALLDRAIDMGKQLNVMWEEAFAEVGVKLGLQSQEPESYKDALRDLIRDLEMRSNLKTGSDKGVVNCGHGVYMRAKKVLGETT